jgi:ComF family protein
MALAGHKAYPLCDPCESRLMRIAEPRCVRCGKELISEELVCWECRQTSRLCSEVLPLFRYRGFAARLIRTYKSGKRFSLAPFWARLIAEEIRLRWPDRVVVPVPPRREKLVSGEMDQVECIAGALEREGLRVERLLVRNSTIQQKKLTKLERKANAISAYALDPRRVRIPPPKVVLLDDVYTTGATLEACAGALLAAGTVDVAAAVLAAD